MGGQVLVSDSTREALVERLDADGPLEAEAKGVAGPVRMWMVRSLEKGESSLVVPSSVSDLVVLASPIEVSLRPLRGKQMGTDAYPATLVKLGVSGGELETECALAMFDAVQVILPPLMGILTVLDSKVITATSGAAGRRTIFVRFGGLDWDVRARLKRSRVPELPGYSAAPAVTAKTRVPDHLQTDADELIAWCRARLAAYKYPRRVVIVPELPKSATGKILRARLRDRGHSAQPANTTNPQTGCWRSPRS